MSSKGMMWRWWRLCLVFGLVLNLPAAFAQTTPAQKGDDLDVTMRVIVDADAKVPDEIVRKIPLPKPAQPATPPANPSDKESKERESRKPAEAAPPGQQSAPGPAGAGPPGQGREFGQQVADEAKKRADEAKRNKPPPPAPREPPGPPGRPPGPPNNPMG